MIIRVFTRGFSVKRGIQLNQNKNKSLLPILKEDKRIFTPPVSFPLQIHLFFIFSFFFFFFSFSFVSLVFSDDDEKQPLQFVLSERMFAPTKVSDYIRYDLKEIIKPFKRSSNRSNYSFQSTLLRCFLKLTHFFFFFVKVQKTISIKSLLRNRKSLPFNPQSPLPKIPVTCSGISSNPSMS